MFYYLTKFHCLVAFTSWDIRQFQFVIFNPWKVPWNRIAFPQNILLQHLVCHITWLDMTLDDLRYLRYKKHFSSFLKGFHWSKNHNFFRRWEPDFNTCCYMSLTKVHIYLSYRCFKYVWLFSGHEALNELKLQNLTTG